MFYYLYEIKNNLDGKIYVGVHKTKNLDDGYMGSGKVIRRAISKHGVENFTKVILEQFENSTAMYAREKEIVTKEFLLREDVYNINRGGHGGFDFINATGLSVRNLKDSSVRQKTHDSFRNRMRENGKTIKEISRSASVSDIMKQQYHDGIRESAFVRLNKDHDFQQKRKNAFANNAHAQGEKNSQFGTMWITDEVSSIKIKKNSIIPKGWRKGRKIK